MFLPRYYAVVYSYMPHRIIAFFSRNESTNVIIVGNYFIKKISTDLMTAGIEKRFWLNSPEAFLTFSFISGDILRAHWLTLVLVS